MTRRIEAFADASKTASLRAALLWLPRGEVAERVLKALEEKLLNQKLFEEFCEEFTRKMNRLRGEHRATLVAGERELARLEARRRKLVESIMEGVPGSEVKDELIGHRRPPRGPAAAARCRRRTQAPAAP